MEEDRLPKITSLKNWRGETKEKTQERMERSRKRSSSAGHEKMERVSDRQEKMEGHCSTDQSPLRAVDPMEEEDKRTRSCSDISGVRVYISPTVHRAKLQPKGIS
jgi:hypothetical protein